MRRREFITFLGGAAAAWPLPARAQQDGRVRRVGVLMNLAEDDPEERAELAAFRQRLRQLGWVEGHNIELIYRWTVGSAARARTLAAELVGIKPDVILVNGGNGIAALLEVTRSVPIVFVANTDPVATGLVASLARPGGNVTGFTGAFEASFAPKWLQLLKELAPGISRVLILNSENLQSSVLLPAIEAAAPALGLETMVARVHDAAEIEQAIDASARQSNIGLLVMPSALPTVHRDLIVLLAARNRLPAVYGHSAFPRSGGLISYSVDRVDFQQKAAAYVDRILRGEKPADLPVQAPTKFELIINLKAAKALGLTIPPTLLVFADGVIE
jgi:putative ABC transport system substrate-binding protein